MEETRAPSLNLAPGKEKALLRHHQWIYSGAVATYPDAETGDVVQVLTAAKKPIGLAFLNPRGQSIAAHMIASAGETIEEALKRKINEAIELRLKWFNPAETNAIRLIHAEGDSLPGLIVDAYNGVLVLQISHPGIDRYKSLIIDTLRSLLNPKAIFEKSTSFLRKKGGLDEVRAHLVGDPNPEVIALESGMQFTVNVQTGQKTGLFLDQREMRAWVRKMARGKKVLNAFAYTGGFSVTALLGGALTVDSVEINAKCEAQCQENIRLNQIDSTQHRFIAEDVFQFVQTADWSYDLVILDPPAFVKKRQDVPKAFRAYKELNRHVIQNMAPRSILLTASCSYHIDEALFANILFRAASEAGRFVKIVSRHIPAIDHPVSIYHPESQYLKSFALYIE
ncbi:MAG: hypothetical protein RL235_530 [Chlamydiota bacterium]